MIPDKLREAWEAVKKSKFEDEKIYAEFAALRDKYLGPIKKKDPLEQCKVVVELSRTELGNSSTVEH